MNECDECGGTGWRWVCSGGFGDDGYCYGIEENVECTFCDGTGIESAVDTVDSRDHWWSVGRG